MKRNSPWLGALVWAAFAAGCSAAEDPLAGGFAAADRATLAHGADLGWLTQHEARGVTWVNAAGTPADPVVLLKEAGLDAVRLRVMVNPDLNSSVGYTDKDHVVAMARRCRDAGLTRLMVDFHFSDTWADPANQKVPAAWVGDDLPALKAHLAAHVTDVLTALQAAGVTPEWVQLGNESTQGILWQGGAVSAKVAGTTGWPTLVTLLNAGYAAVKAVDPAILVVLHLDRGYDEGLYRWWFDNYRAAGGLWDVTGLSFYPYWQPQGTVAQLAANLNAVTARYGKPAAVVEVGGPETDPAGTRTLLADVKAAVASVPGQKGLGVFYWEPGSHSSVTGYALGATRRISPKVLQFTEALAGLGYR